MRQGVTYDPIADNTTLGRIGEALPVPELVAAILIATSSNNLMKAAYCLGFSGWRASAAPVLALVAITMLFFARRAEVA